jgi:hypothetical protein
LAGGQIGSGTIGKSEAVQEAAVDRDWVLGELKKVYELAKPEASDGETRAVHLSAAVRALELIGTELGMFVKRRPSAPKPIDQMSEAEVLDLLGGEPSADELRTLAGELLRLAEDHSGGDRVFSRAAAPAPGEAGRGAEDTEPG